MNTYQIIKKAILEKRSITCEYKGYTRKMSPHTLGKKDYREKALFIQYSGQSSSGLSSDMNDNWRCVFVSELNNLKINSDTFVTASNHSRKQTCIDVVDVEIKY